MGDAVSFREGDHVLYYPTGAENNPTFGVIEEIVYPSTSSEVPRYVITNDKTHKMTAYKLENIIQKVDGDEKENNMEEIEDIEIRQDLEKEDEELYDPETIDIDVDESESDEYEDEKEIVR